MKNFSTWGIFRFQDIQEMVSKKDIQEWYPRMISKKDIQDFQEMQTNSNLGAKDIQFMAVKDILEKRTFTQNVFRVHINSVVGELIALGDLDLSSCLGDKPR